MGCVQHKRGRWSEMRRSRLERTLARKLGVPGGPIRSSVFHQLPQHRKCSSPSCWAAPLAAVSLMESLQKAAFNREIPRWPVETERTACSQEHRREQDSSQIHMPLCPHVIIALPTHPKACFHPVFPESLSPLFNQVLLDCTGALGSTSCAGKKDTGRKGRD